MPTYANLGHQSSGEIWTMRKIYKQNILQAKISRSTVTHSDLCGRIKRIARALYLVYVECSIIMANIEHSILAIKHGSGR